MIARRLIALTALALTVSGCVGGLPMNDVASRAEPLSASVSGATTPDSRSYRVTDVRVMIPEELTVSEANTFLPNADIVWRGDPYGDRKAQISTILRDSFVSATQGLDGETPVVVTLTLHRWHSLTERTRYSIGGIHTIRFDLAVTHAETGELIDGPRFINADFPGFGGQAAVQAEARGDTQKVRITRQLQSIALMELGPEGMVTHTAY